MRCNMKYKVIKTKKEYVKMLARIDDLFDSTNGDAGDELELLTLLVEDYEKKHYPIEPPDPIEAIKFIMEQMNLKQADVAKYFGGKNRASEVLNRKRNLTIQMIYKLHKNLKIPLTSLIQSKKQTYAKI